MTLRYPAVLAFVLAASPLAAQQVPTQNQDVLFAHKVEHSVAGISAVARAHDPYHDLDVEIRKLYNASNGKCGEAFFSRDKGTLYCGYVSGGTGPDNAEFTEAAATPLSSTQFLAVRASLTQAEYDRLMNGEVWGAGNCCTVDLLVYKPLAGSILAPAQLSGGLVRVAAPTIFALKSAGALVPMRDFGSIMAEIMEARKRVAPNPAAAGSY